MGGLLYITSCFSLAVFEILSLSLLFGILIIMCLILDLFWFILFGALVLSELGCQFPSGNFSAIFSSNKFSTLFSLFFWDPYSVNVSLLNVIEVPYQFSFLKILFYLLLFGLFPLSCLPDCCTASSNLLLIPCSVFFISVIMFFSSNWLFFVFSISLSFH